MLFIIQICGDAELGVGSGCFRHRGRRCHEGLILDGAFINVVADVAFLHPSVGEAIKERTLQTVPQVVFRYTGCAWIVAHGKLHEPAALKGKERGQEAMHAIEERYAFCHVGTHHLQRTARVGGSVARYMASEAIGNLRLQLLENRIFSLCTNAGYKVMVVDMRK